MQFDGEKLLADVVDEKKNLASLLNSSISLRYSLHDVVEFSPKTKEIISLRRKGTQAMGGKVLNKVAPGSEKTIIKEISDYFLPYCCFVEWLFRSYFVIAIPLNMSIDKFDQIASECFYEIKLGIRKEE